MELDIKVIMERLPHRYPMLLSDRVLKVEPGKSIVAIKNVSINEPFFNGHFPHHPVMPGVLILEAMAQAAVLFSFTDENGGLRSEDAKIVYYLAGIDDARIRRPVVPGDQLRIEVKAERLSRRMCVYKGYAYVDAGRAGDHEPVMELVADATLKCAIRSLEK
jgi:3-hydroxyacyl-[acyl-carrier-protein] dehydratase